jgi:hypothetical protein
LRTERKNGLIKYHMVNKAWWHMPEISSFLEAEAGGSRV